MDNKDKDDDDGYAVVEELPMEKIISQDNICYDQVLASVGADTKPTTTSTVTRESGKDSKTKLHHRYCGDCASTLCVHNLYAIRVV